MLHANLVANLYRQEIAIQVTLSNAVKAIRANTSVKPIIFFDLQPDKIIVNLYALTIEAFNILQTNNDLEIILVSDYDENYLIK